MKQPVLLLSIGFVSCLVGCKPRAPTSETVSEPGNVSAIDYAHESGGVFHHGTITLIGTDARATWTTTDRAGLKSTRDMPMSEETFRKLWDALNTVPDFEAGIVQHADTRIDPATFHVVGIIFNFGGQKGIRTHLISPESASPAFKEWLQAIGYTGQ